MGAPPQNEWRRHADKAKPGQRRDIPETTLTVYSEPLSGGPHSHLAGRAAELQVVISALHTVEQGETAAVLLSGSSGVGKSELLRTSASLLRESGAVVLFGACLDIRDVTLLAMRQAIRQHVSQTDGDGGAATDLLALLDGETQGEDRLGDGEIIERVSRGLRALAGGQPLVLVLDDLQWADRTTERLLRYLLAGVDGSRVLVVGAVRTEAPAAMRPLPAILSELYDRPAVRVLPIAPLGVEATRALVESIVGSPVSDAYAERIWARSGGHPLVIEALATGDPEDLTSLPAPLRETVLARIAALPTAARTVLQTVAVGVEPVSHSLLTRVLTLGEELAIESVRTLVGEQILEVIDGAYRFRVGVVKEAIESVLLPGEKARLHRQYAEALEAGGPGDPRRSRLAHHRLAAGQDEWALHAAILDGGRADAAYQVTEAFRCWSIALEALDRLPGQALEGVDRAAVSRAAAEAAHHAGEHEAALAILGTGPPICSWHIDRARYLAATGRLSDAEAEYELAFAADGCDPRELAVAGAHSADLLVQLGRYGRAAERAQAALDLARRHGERSAAVLASSALGFSQACLDNDPEAGRRVIEEALHEAERSGRRVDIAAACLHLAELLTGPSNDVAAGITCALDGASRCESWGIARTFGARLLAIAANGQFRLGRWSEAEASIDRGLRHRPSGAEAAELLLARCRIAIGFGHLGAAASDLDAVETLAAGDSTRHMLPLLILRAGLAMWRGDHANAREAIRRGLELHERRSTEDLVLKATLLWHGLRAEAEAKAGGQDVDQATVVELRRAVEQIRGAKVTAAPPVHDVISGYLGLCDAELTRIAGAADPEAWARAEALWSSRQPYPAAYAALREADARYTVRTRNRDADQALRRAYRTARPLRAQPLLDEITNLAARARLSLDEPAAVPEQRPGAAVTSDRSGPLATLTSREVEVLTLVAEGLTNNDIARRLRIKPATVGVHVSHVLEKLHVRSRVGASAIFQRESARRDGA